MGITLPGDQVVSSSDRSAVNSFGIEARFDGRLRGLILWLFGVESPILLESRSWFAVESLKNHISVIEITIIVTWHHMTMFHDHIRVTIIVTIIAILYIHSLIPTYPCKHNHTLEASNSPSTSLPRKLLSKTLSVRTGAWSDCCSFSSELFLVQSQLLILKCTWWFH